MEGAEGADDQMTVRFLLLLGAVLAARERYDGMSTRVAYRTDDHHTSRMVTNQFLPFAISTADAPHQHTRCVSKHLHHSPPPSPYYPTTSQELSDEELTQDLDDVFILGAKLGEGASVVGGVMGRA
jgi:hypothetical protein